MEPHPRHAKPTPCRTLLALLILVFSLAPGMLRAEPLSIHVTPVVKQPGATVDLPMTALVDASLQAHNITSLDLVFEGPTSTTEGCAAASPCVVVALIEHESGLEITVSDGAGVVHASTSVTVAPSTAPTVYADTVALKVLFLLAAVDAEQVSSSKLDEGSPGQSQATTPPPQKDPDPPQQIAVGPSGTTAGPPPPLPVPPEATVAGPSQPTEAVSPAVASAGQLGEAAESTDAAPWSAYTALVDGVASLVPTIQGVATEVGAVVSSKVAVIPPLLPRDLAFSPFATLAELIDEPLAVDTPPRVVPFTIDLLPLVGMSSWYDAPVTRYVAVNLLGGYAAGSKGFEVGGVVNIDEQLTAGAQLAGGANVVLGNGAGLQLSVANTVLGTMEGVQLGGVNTTAGEYAGVQVGGVNTTVGGHTGVQVGAVNTTAGGHAGVQVGGVNFGPGAGRAVQLGLVNVGDADDVSVGMLSVVTDGWLSFTAWVEETGFVHLGVVHGGEHVQNTYSLGILPSMDGTMRTSFGMGIGAPLSLTSWGDVVPELMVNFVNEGLWSFSPAINLQVRALFGWRFSGDAKLFVGPVLDVLFAVPKVTYLTCTTPSSYGSDKVIHEVDSYEPSLTSLDLGCPSDNWCVSMWLGVHLGVQL